MPIAAYFFYIHSCIIYVVIVWVSTSQIKLQKILTKQKHPAQVIFDINKETLQEHSFKN